MATAAAAAAVEQAAKTRKRRRTDSNPRAGSVADYREQLNEARQAIDCLNECIINPRKVAFRLRCMGMCHQCYRLIANCSCNDSKEQKVKRLVEFINRGEIRDDEERNSAIAVLSALLDGSPMSFNAIPYKRSNAGDLMPPLLLDLVCEIFIHMADDNGTFLLRNNALRHTLKLLCRAGLSLNTTIHEDATALGYACRRSHWLAFEFLAITTENADAKDAQGRSALFIACDTQAPSTLIEQLVARSSDAALNHAVKGETPPLFRCIEIYFANLKEEDVDSGDPQNMFQTIRVLLRAAHDDGSGLDLIGKTDGMTALEYVLNTSNAFGVHAYNSAWTEVASRTESVHLKRSRFLPTLFEAFKVCLPVNEVIYLVGEYTAPYFKDLRPGAKEHARGADELTSPPPARPKVRAAAAAAAAGAETDGMADYTDN